MNLDESQLLLCENRHNPICNDIRWRNLLFHSWSVAWENEAKVASERGVVAFSVDASVYERQDVVVGLVWDGEVISGHCYSFYHLSNISDDRLDYFNKIGGKSTWEIIQSNDIDGFMSLEQYYVSERYRNTRRAVLVTDVMLSVALRYFFYETELDAIVTLARRTKGVAGFIEKRGFFRVVDEIKYWGDTASLMVLTREMCSESRSLYDSRAHKIWNGKVMV